MGKIKDKHLGIVIDRELHHKLRFVSEYDGRSANGQILYLLRKYIAEFEEKNGKIEVPDEPAK